MKIDLPKTPREFGFFINGKSHKAGSREVFERISPAHDVVVTKIPMCTKADLDDAVKAARAAFVNGWGSTPASARAAILLKAAALIRERTEEIALYETLENGKAISASRGEVTSCAEMFELAAGLARMVHGDTFNNLGEKEFAIVTREPIGVVGVITPWNFPFLILCERIPYILAAGCTVVVKPSEFTSATSILLAEILHDAGLPAGVMNVVPGYGQEVGAAMAEHMDIDLLSFTGSTRTGRGLLAAAASSNFKKLGLELGGKNPQIVFADADLQKAAQGVAAGISYNTGQVCVSGSRLIVERSIADKFTEMVREVLASKKIGDPLDEDTDIGAITTTAQFEVIQSYVKKGQAEGATLVWGGEVLDLGRGQFVAPAIFANVKSNMPIAQEEIFGPVLSVIPFDTLDEAIAIANDTVYGLAASVWSKNIDKALGVTRRVQAGRFWVNTTLSGGPELPIGGFKQSGWGREAGMYGVEEYMQIKNANIVLGE